MHNSSNSQRTRRIEPMFSQPRGQVSHCPHNIGPVHCRALEPCVFHPATDHTTRTHSNSHPLGSAQDHMQLLHAGQCAVQFHARRRPRHAACGPGRPAHRRSPTAQWAPRLQRRVPRPPPALQLDSHGPAVAECERVCHCSRRYLCSRRHASVPHCGRQPPNGTAPCCVIGHAPAACCQGGHASAFGY